jgi:hypothetical protein
MQESEIDHMNQLIVGKIIYFYIELYFSIINIEDMKAEV